MSQTFTDDVFAGSHAGKTDLQNMENNFQALKSGFSGTSAPSNMVGGMTWHDSTARKIRNYANVGWLVSLLGDASQKMWVHRNNTCEGWLIDATVTDRVLALKGGAYSYNVSGGATAGAWAISGVSVDSHAHDVQQHTHQIYENIGANIVFGSNGTAGALGPTQSAQYGIRAYRNLSVPRDELVGQDLYAKLNTSYNTGSTAPNASGSGAWRPAAAVGTLQYPDLS